MYVHIYYNCSCFGFPSIGILFVCYFSGTEFFSNLYVIVGVFFRSHSGYVPICYIYLLK
jgi:hypothetical protein